MAKVMDDIFPEVRRRDRVLEESEALDLLEAGEYGFLSVGVGAGGYAYGVPMSYAFDRGGGVLHFHCAPQGHKLEAIRCNGGKASFCVVGRTEPQGAKFTTLYESVIVFGDIVEAAGDEEKRNAVRALVGKYCPDDVSRGEVYMERSLPRTHTFSMKIVKITGKCKR